MRILSILSHPDDEIIFGWPIFQHLHIKKHLICATGSPERLEALDAVSKILNFTWECINIPDGKVSEHSKELSKSIIDTVSKFDPQYTFTHNPHGEYNHPDHIAIFNTVFKMSSIGDLLISDMSISLEGSGFPDTPLTIPENERIAYYTNCLCSLDRQTYLYDQAKSIYQQHKSWTWGKRNTDKAKLFFVKMTLIHRKNHLEILSSLLCPDQCTIAEVGVYKGYTTEYLAQCDNVKKIYAIDPWKNINGYTDHYKLLKDLRRSNTHGEPIPLKSWHQLYLYVRDKLSKYDNIEILQKTSQEAAACVNEELDLVFVDGDHTYDSVMLDLSLWCPKIKSKGILSGHDYTWYADGKNKRPLVRAVIKYFTENADVFEPVIDIRRNQFINRQSDRIWWQQKK